MKTKLETVNAIKKKITVDLPAERVVEALEKAYQKVQKKAKMNGFREGKIPRNLLEIHFKRDAENKAVELLIDGSFTDALKKEAAEPVSRPNVVSVGPFQKDAPLTYTLEFEVSPTVELKDYHGLTLEKTEREVKDEYVDKRLESIQRSMTQLEPAKDDAALGDGYVAFVDFKGTADGKEFKGGKADNFLVDVGGGSLLPEFEKEMMGMKKGENKKVEFDYPKDYFNKELAGKHGQFDVTIKELKFKRVPELNDDLAKDMGNYKTLSEVKADIKKRMVEAVEHEEKKELADRAMEELVKKHKFEVPESVAVQELKDMFDGFVRQLQAQGKKFEETGMKVEQFVEQYKPVAEGRVKGYYILDAIAKAEKIEVLESDIEERLKTTATNVNQPLEKVKEYYETNNLLGGLKFQILNDKTLDFVITKAKIETKKAKKQ
ncbi:MAG: trigger factor [Deltaproteobacteria bacterium CG11_big_fil_rev_8_21_14_0_20_49_13]|nr:MAG: trigger factor [Deltaproteobacteria bacterium CG11_big_fil_rev_8_21_14_0_20_49_13]